MQRGASKGVVSAGTLKQRLLSGGAWTLGSRIVAAVSGFAVNALLSRMISPTDFGTYFLLVSVVSVGAMAAQLGLHVAVVRMIAEALGQRKAGRARGVIRDALVLCTSSALVVGCVLSLFGGTGVLAIFGSQKLAGVMWIGGIWLVGTVLLGLVGESFRGLHDYRLAGAIGPAGANLAFLAALLTIFLASGSTDLAVASGAGALVTGVVATSGLVVLRARMHKLGPAEKVSPGELLSMGLPLLVTSVAIFVSTQADLWILGIYRAKEEVAMYGAAIRLVALVMMPMLMMNAVLAPVISELFSQGNKARLERMLRVTAALTALPALAALAVLLLAAHPILEWVYGTGYGGGAVALILVSLGQTVNVLCGSAATVLMMTGHQRAVMTISATAGAGLVIGGMLMVDRYGMEGVAAVVAATTALHGLACLAWVRRSTRIWTHCGLRSLADAFRELASFVRRPQPEA